MTRSQPSAGPRVRGLGPTRAEVLAHLRELATGVPVAELSEALGLHPNTARFHLDALVRSGLVRREVERRSHPGRPKVLYRAEGVRAEPDHHRDLARAMVVHFAGSLRDKRARAEASGRAWGEELRRDALLEGPDADPLGRLVRCFTHMGYRPRLTGDPDHPAVEFAFCPYRELAAGTPGVVCQLHFGLLQGLLGPDGPWQVTGLHAWAAPDKCLAILAKRVPAAVVAPAPGPADAEKAE